MKHGSSDRNKRRTTVLGFGVSVGIVLAAAVAFVFAGAASSGTARVLVAPAPTTFPSISGTPTDGQKLTGDKGTWSGSPTDYNDNWRRCDKTGASCADISGSGGDTYTVTTADVGSTIRFQVGAQNADGRTFASSAPTAVVAAATPTPTTTTTTTTTATTTTTPASGVVQVASVALPDRLVISGVAFAPSVVTSRSAFQARFRVTNLAGNPVQGALVYELGLPYGWVRDGQEQPTGADGWATISVAPNAQLPLGRSGALVVFVRARKPGDNLLAGVSTRRLVQVRLG
jgi:hypothetical protein